MKRKFKAALFDLDGVIVDTAKYHYLAWKELAGELGFDFSERDNEQLKGVSRMRSLELLLTLGGVTLSAVEKERAARKKNTRYVEYISHLDQADLLPGARDCLNALRSRGVKTALVSASKNAPLIIHRVRISQLFDAVVDGNRISRAKPDPEIFFLGAVELDLPASNCAVFEDAQAGIVAARAAGMFVVGIGEPGTLAQADLVIGGLSELEVDSLF